MSKASVRYLEVIVDAYSDDVGGAEYDENGNPSYTTVRFKVDIQTGKILDATPVRFTTEPDGSRVHIKARDAGVYRLLDEKYAEIACIEDYVPAGLDIDRAGYGDYIIFSITDDGYIKDWNGKVVVDDIYKTAFGEQAE